MAAVQNERMIGSNRWLPNYPSITRGERSALGLRLIFRHERSGDRPAEIPVEKETGGCLGPPGKYYFVEERHARGGACFRRLKTGLFTFTMMMKTERITKSLVTEKLAFCMPISEHAPYH